MKRIDLPVRFDVITVTGRGADARIEHFEDAFRAPMG
jgi:Holliday junction resolvase-like predicted endonuclease